MQASSNLALAFLLALLPGVLTLTQPIQAQPNPVLEGTITGPGGEPMERADVSVYAPGGIYAPRDGGLARVGHQRLSETAPFRVSVDTTGIVHVKLTGVHHRPLSFDTYVAAGDTVELDARLARYPSPDSLTGLFIVGSFNDFRFVPFRSPPGGVAMTRQDDGTYAATVPTPGDSLVYQVNGLTEHRNPINAFPIFFSWSGTSSEAEAVLQRATYRSVQATPSDSTRIVFDPSATTGASDPPVRFAPKAPFDAAAAPVLRFQDSTSVAARFASYHRAYIRELRAYMRFMWRARQDSSLSPDAYDASGFENTLDEALSYDDSPAVVNAMLVLHLFWTPEPTAAVAQRALASLPADTPLWNYVASDLPRPIGWGLVGATMSATGRPDAYRAYAHDVLRTNPSRIVRSDLLYALTRQAKTTGDRDRQHIYYTWLQESHPNALVTEMAQRRINPLADLRPGATVPSFEVPALADASRTFTPKTFDGQYVLLDFWATWCAPCIEEFPTLKTAYDRFADDGFTILSLSVDESRETVTEFLADYDQPWPHAFVPEGLQSDLMARFQVDGVPTLVLVAPDGTIVSTERDALTGEALLDTLERELGEGDVSSER
ncbi:TlpA family protein disulfide reductase [Salisaeta longa]|uniref:TlpA family protein disulfide reductase n=1 Tax=Salisaeta longa TaxID=503170 RepID=UPI00146A55AB|nr:TlpA disulfide reductase family protein [Salisaeta longa]